MWNICSFEYMMGGMKSNFTEVVTFWLKWKNHVKFDEAIFQDDTPKICIIELGRND